MSPTYVMKINDQFLGEASMAELQHAKAEIEGVIQRRIAEWDSRGRNAVVMFLANDDTDEAAKELLMYMATTSSAAVNCLCALLPEAEKKKQEWKEVFGRQDEKTSPSSIGEALETVGTLGTVGEKDG